MRRSFTNATLFFICFSMSTRLLAQNVGIGTNAPTQKLDVNGGLRVRGLQNSSTGGALLRADSAGNLKAEQVPAIAAQSFGTATALGSATSPNVTAISQRHIKVAAIGTTVYVLNATLSTQTPGGLPRYLDIYNCTDPATPALQSTTLLGSTPSDLAIA